MTDGTKVGVDETLDVILGRAKPRHGPDGRQAVARLQARLFGSNEYIFRLGRYELREELGRGADCAVHLGYDPELRRPVAIKLLRLPAYAPTEGDDGGQTTDAAQLVVEARALAVLSHPNIVRIYDSGTYDLRDEAEDGITGVFLVMELVEGCDLATWLERDPPMWKTVLEVFIAVGRGLAAVHQAGVIHGDIKPANILLGNDGVPKIVDFGLARANLQATSWSRDADERTDVERGGTPLYMAPEQHAGSAGDVLSDQFSFCAAFYQALYGDHVPRTHRTSTPMLTAVDPSGRKLAKSRKVPRWLLQIVLRGLANDPKMRWPSMDALVAALVAGRARNRRSRFALATGVVAVLAVSTAVWPRWDRARRVAECELASEALAEVWNESTRHALTSALQNTGVSHAALTARNIVIQLDHYASAWKGASERACITTLVRGSWTSEVFERANWCLEERRTEFEALIDELLRADEELAHRAVLAAASLPRLVACEDAHLLEQLQSPPARERQAVSHVRADLSRVRALEIAGRYTPAHELARDVVERAILIDWPSLVATARAQEASILQKMGAYEEAERAGTSAYYVAAASGAWDVAATTAILLTSICGHHLAHHEDGLMWNRHAELALSQLGGGDECWEADRLAALALVHHGMGSLAMAKTTYERALSIFEEALGSDHPRTAYLLNNLGVMHQDEGNYDEAWAYYERALLLREETLGSNHPSLVSTLLNLGATRKAANRVDEALLLLQRALRIAEITLGPKHVETSNVLNNLGVLYFEIGQLDEARALHERALAIREAKLGSQHPQVARSLGNLANVVERVGDLDGARALLERAIMNIESSYGSQHPLIASMSNNLGVLSRKQGRLDDAHAFYERALALWELTYGPTHLNVAMVLSNLSNIQADRGAYDEALNLQKRALGIREALLDPGHPELAASMVELAHLHKALHEIDQYRALLESAVSIYDSLEDGQERSAKLRHLLAETDGFTPPGTASEAVGGRPQSSARDLESK